ncbi:MULTISPECIES: hypothetical protein [unclassified Burkholderia]|uniref:hypothetical protein n=1 Tax=unclassified Burkholderia TaxID=2613784 RepID=UPI0021AB44E8|nr:MULTISPECIES: hypothetical protein [unclassified Burkholderia]
MIRDDPAHPFGTTLQGGGDVAGPDLSGSPAGVFDDDDWRVRHTTLLCLLGRVAAMLARFMDRPTVLGLEKSYRLDATEKISTAPNLDVKRRKTLLAGRFASNRAPAGPPAITTAEPASQCDAPNS